VGKTSLAMGIQDNNSTNMDKSMTIYLSEEATADNFVIKSKIQGAINVQE